jgi:hypothetical protein
LPQDGHGTAVPCAAVAFSTSRWSGASWWSGERSPFGKFLHQFGMLLILGLGRKHKFVIVIVDIFEHEPDLLSPAHLDARVIHGDDVGGKSQSR